MHPLRMTVQSYHMNVSALSPATEAVTGWRQDRGMAAGISIGAELFKILRDRVSPTKLGLSDLAPETWDKCQLSRSQTVRKLLLYLRRGSSGHLFRLDVRPEPQNLIPNNNPDLETAHV